MKSLPDRKHYNEPSKSSKMWPGDILWEGIPKPGSSNGGDPLLNPPTELLLLWDLEKKAFLISFEMPSRNM